MILPCDTCKFKTVREEGHRIFIGCVDKEKKKENFEYDSYWYHHTCKAYEKEESEE